MLMLRRIFGLPVVPVAHTSGRPSMPREPEKPPCSECIELGIALTAARGLGDRVAEKRIQEQIVSHFDEAHCT
ncbi:hypothetical protein SMD11_1177 [Streptomyces albireticuli]|uniref:Uncharacterized protein n=1 Tax=Streptomyces albireticuli TaxID=1940 RepID=A0A1Z2KXT3_9ACTN|nr:hypothetical protein [Streptomyces albireticuli]ARZ66840.1 hypothetical protein SMD11_1177 [Streptomyces albireticuli]